MVVQPDPVLAIGGKKNVLGHHLSLSDMLLFALSIYLLQVSLCFSCLAFFFFFLRSHDFYFPWRVAFRKHSLGAPVLTAAGMLVMPQLLSVHCLLHTLTRHCLRLSISMHTPKLKFTLSDPAPSHPLEVAFAIEAVQLPLDSSPLAAFAVK